MSIIAQQLEAAQRRFAAMSDEEKAAVWEAQRQSFIRGMAPCEHGIADFEDCPKCRGTDRETENQSEN